MDNLGTETSRKWASQYIGSRWAKERRIEYLELYGGLSRADDMMYRYSDTEVKKEILREKIDIIVKNIDVCHEVYALLRGKGWSYWEATAWIRGDRVVGGIEKLNGELETKKKMLYFISNPDKYKKDELDIDLAKSHSVAEHIEVNSFGFAKCPFHGNGVERTGSMKVYDDGKAHCFSCSWHGDVLDFLQELNGWDFVQTVKYLTGK